MPAVAETLDTVQSLTQGGYKWGFESDIETDLAPKGLNEDIVRLISERRGEPEWLLEWRLKAYRHWLTMEEPNWGRHVYERVDYQALHYYASPKKKAGPTSLDEVDPELLRVYEKLGIPLKEQAILAGVEPKGDQGEQNGPDIGAALARSSNIAVDAVFDSVSVATTFQKTLRESGVIFCPISEAVREHPELVRQYLGSVVPAGDNFFAALNSAVFTDGSFAFIPKGVRCPMELSTYFRINARNTGQFERTLIIAEEGASCRYLEGCTAPQRDENQLHAAVVELVALDDATIKYSTVQNWYPGDAAGKGGVYNFVTKRAACRGARSKVSWTQVETGSAITWKYPSCILQGEDSRGRVLLGGGDQQPPAGRHRHQDDPHRQGLALHHRLQGHQRRAQRQHLSRPGADHAQGGGRAELHPVRQPADRRPVRRAHRALHREPQPHGEDRARGHHLAASPTTSCSTAASAGSRRRTRWG